MRTPMPYPGVSSSW